jgi:hypothetical protein
VTLHLCRGCGSGLSSVRLCGLKALEFQCGHTRLGFKVSVRLCMGNRRHLGPLEFGVLGLGFVV